MVAGYVVTKLDGFGTCMTDVHTLEGVALWETRKTVGRCAFRVAADRGCSLGDLPGYFDGPRTMEAAQAENDKAAEEQAEAAGESGAGSDADEVITEVDDEAAADIVIRHGRAEGTSGGGDTRPVAVREFLKWKQYGRWSGMGSDSAPLPHGHQMSTVDPNDNLQMLRNLVTF